MDRLKNIEEEHDERIAGRKEVLELGIERATNAGNDAIDEYFKDVAIEVERAWRRKESVAGNEVERLPKKNLSSVSVELRRTSFSISRPYIGKSNWNWITSTGST
ncbi:MAG: hypothetical protein GY820_35610 [Gammaproteobacteria bacterium]|nr:hypothetical protein [Gammaproteobacteria bacterium]